MKTKALFSLAIIASTTPLFAVVEYTTVNSSYTEDFDTLAETGTASWSDNATIDGWYSSIAGTTPTTYNTGDGSASYQGRLISAGSSGSSDRALAYQQESPSSGPNMIGAGFANNTGALLDAFSLSYSGEQWRYIGGESPTVMTFEYQIFASGAGSLTAESGWTSASALDFTSPETGPSSSSVDGNTTGKETISATVSSISWQDGEELWIRWSVSGASSRAIVGVDDVVFSAVPETSTYAAILGCLSFVGLLVTRRKARAL